MRTDTQTVYAYSACLEDRARWDEFIAAMHSGERLEIDGDMFDYFLDVLPPIYLGRVVEVGGERVRASFGFAEGEDFIVAFWRKDGRYFCQQTTEMARGR